MLVAGSMLLVTVPLVVALGLLLPQLHLIQGRWRWAVPTAGLGVCGIAAVVAVAQGGYDADRPRGDSLFFAADADTGRAAWASRERAADAWTAQVLKDGTFGGLAEYGPFSLRYLREPAPAPVLPPPTAELLGETTTDRVTTLRVRIRPAAGARTLWFAVPGAEVLGGTVNGRPLPVPNTPAKRSDWQLRFTAPPPEGVEVALSLAARGERSLVLTGVSDGLPDAGGKRLLPRPPELMPSPSVRFDSSTLVTTRIPLPVR
jgi:hypothetical protein